MPVEVVARPPQFPPKRVRFSSLKHIGRSAAHYRAGILTGTSETAAMRMGSAVHVASLGGELVVFNGERKGNPWKAFKGLLAGDPHFIFDDPHRGKAWEHAKAEADGRLIVTSDDAAAAEAGAELQRKRAESGQYPAPIVTRPERDKAFAVAEAIMTSEAATYLEGRTEVYLEWEYLGRECAGQLDVIRTDSITDLKNTANADPWWFDRHAIKMGYPAQLAWYREGARQNGHTVDECYIVAVEPTPPYAPTPRRLTAELLEQGEKQVRVWVERLLGCERFDEYPAYRQTLTDMDVPDEFGLTFDDEEAE